MRVLVPTKWLRRQKRAALAEVTPAGVPNTVLFGDNTVPFVPASYLANLPDPSSAVVGRDERQDDPFGYMTPRLPWGIPWTVETEQRLAYQWVEWAQRHAGRG